jgi:hypothetical protein
MESISRPSPNNRGMNNSSSSNNSNRNIPRDMEQAGPPEVALPSKPSVFRRMWNKLGINAFVVMFVVKGALPPTIAIAIYQRYSVASNYLNLGYVMIVISILSVPVLPRGKYLMNLLITLVSMDPLVYRFVKLTTLKNRS